MRLMSFIENSKGMQELGTHEIVTSAEGRAPIRARAASTRITAPGRVCPGPGARVRSAGRAMERVDVLVIGAGVVGLAVARRLATAGREVVVAEAAEAIGTGTSSRNSEVIHAGIYYPKGSLKARLCVAGREALYAYCADTGRPAPADGQADRGGGGGGGPAPRGGPRGGGGQRRGAGAAGRGGGRARWSRSWSAKARCSRPSRASWTAMR